jgi:hypothetical protein
VFLSKRTGLTTTTPGVPQPAISADGLNWSGFGYFVGRTEECFPRFRLRRDLGNTHFSIEPAADGSIVTRLIGPEPANLPLAFRPVLDG